MKTAITFLLLILAALVPDFGTGAGTSVTDVSAYGCVIAAAGAPDSCLSCPADDAGRSGLRPVGLVSCGKVRPQMRRSGWGGGSLQGACVEGTLRFRPFFSSANCGFLPAGGKSPRYFIFQRNLRI